MRKSKDRYFLDIAETASEQATCDRLHCGAVLVRDNSVLATGYNGSISKQPHCDEVGHYIVNSHCKRTIHAEVNAGAQASKNGVSLNGATCYTNWTPCWDCYKFLVQCGVIRFVYLKAYGNVNYPYSSSELEEMGLPVPEQLLE